MVAIDWTNLYKKHKGKWVALKDDEVTVITSGLTAKGVLQSAQRKGYRRPILFRVPSKMVLRVG